MGMILPPNLKEGDVVRIVATAGKIDEEPVLMAKKSLELSGFTVELGHHVFAKSHQFAGTDEQRRADLQHAIDDPQVSAVLCARGGYGSVRILDGIDWNEFRRNPKWICGYSDVTAIHGHCAAMGIASLHTTMPINFGSNTKESVQSLVESLKGKSQTYSIEAHPSNRMGECSGELTGGNLSVICGLLGSSDQLKTENRLLFLEDVGEHLYHVDRMMMALKRAGLFKSIRGLIIGGMTDMKENDPPFGSSIYELVLSKVEEFNCPVVFDFPSGHIENNMALILGKECHLSVGNEVRFRQ